MKIRLISGHFLFCQDLRVLAVLFLSSHQTQFPTLSDSRSGSFPAISFQLSNQTYFLPCLSSSFMFPAVFLAIGLNFPPFFLAIQGLNFSPFFLAIGLNFSPFFLAIGLNLPLFFLAIGLNLPPFFLAIGLNFFAIFSSNRTQFQTLSSVYLSSL